MIRIFSRLILIVSLAFYSLGTQAAVTTYFSFASFSSAAGGFTSYDFSGVATPVSGSSFPAFDSLNPLVLGSISISPESQAFVLANDAFSSSPGAPYGLGKFFTSQAGSTNAITFTSSTPIYGLGVNFGTYVGPVTDAGLTVSVGGGSTAFPGQVATASVPDVNKIAFLGVISSTPFSTIVFTPTNGGSGMPSTFDITSFFTVATPVPEPSLPLMLVVGLGLIGMVVRRKGS